MRLRVGLIGLGDAWQARYAPALRALADRFEVRAICDQVRHRADLAAAEFQAEAVDGYHALVQREDIDAIMVLSGQLFRALPVLAACESRKAIYCAVGLEMNAEEAANDQTPRRGGGSCLCGRISPPARPGHPAAERTDRHPLGSAAATVLPPTGGGRVGCPRPERLAVEPSDVPAPDRAGRLVPLRHRPQPTSVVGVMHSSATRTGRKTTA